MLLVSIIAYFNPPQLGIRPLSPSVSVLPSPCWHVVSGIVKEVKADSAIKSGFMEEDGTWRSWQKWRGIV